MNLCYTLGWQNFNNVIRTISDNNLYEIRLDVLDIYAQDIEKLLKTSKNLIISFRPNLNKGPDFMLPIIHSAIDLGVKYVDLDIKNDLNLIKDIVSKAKETRTKVILSYHNHKYTEGIHELRTIAQKCKDLGANLIKIATTVNNTEDLKNLMAIYAYIPNVMAMGMGPLGKQSRVLSALFEPPFIYTYVGAKNKLAVGQISSTDLNKINKIFIGLKN